MNNQVNKTISDPEIVAMLEWYKMSGVEEAVLDEPGDWFAWEERTPPQRSPGRQPLPEKRRTQRQSSPGRPITTSPRTPQQSLSTPPNEAVLIARETARSAKSLDELEKALKSFEGCGLSKTATNLCFSRGSPNADIMLIGDAPGRDEDIEGKPFVGEAGGLLDKMLKAIDLDEQNVHITNSIYWRPPGNRAPTPLEAQICQPFIERQLEFVAPKIVIFLGGTTAKQMLGTNEAIMRLRGKWRDYKLGDTTIPSMAMLHPNYLLRAPAAKRLAWSDLLSIRAKLDS